MKSNYYDDPDFHVRDHDQCDQPRGTGNIRRERGILWFKWQGSWWQVGTLPPEIRDAYLRAEINRERSQHNTTR
jgi:hypothetical protein